MFDFSPDDELGTAFWSSPAWLAQARPYRPGMFWLGRHPHDYSIPIGARLNRHAFLCADTQTGKGRSIVLNNGALWPGSYIDVTPKGENASILAARRGAGNAHCDGLSQDVYVLDPFAAADVEASLRGFFDPLDEIDPEDPLDGATRIIHAMKIETPGAGESKKWLDLGAEFAAKLLTHLYTSDQYTDREKHLVTLRRLVTAGKADDYEEFRRLHEQGAFDKEFEEGTLEHLPDPFELLIRELQGNPACGNTIRDFGLNLESNERKHGNYFESVRKSADDITKWLDNPKLAAQVTGSAMDPSRRLRLARIKDDPKGVSVFICLPTSRKEGFAAWQRMLIELMLHRFKDMDAPPATGRKILMSVDEFLGYGRMDSIQSGMTEIAGAGVALFLSVQQLGRLKEIYKEGWEVFASSAGLSIWFGLDEKDGALKHISELLGEQTIRRIGHSSNSSFSESQQTSRAAGETYGYNRSTSRTQGTGGSSTLNRSHTTNSGSSTGRNSGTTSRGGTLIDLLPSHNRGRNYGSHHGRSDTTGSSEGTSWQKSSTEQQGENFSHTVTNTETSGTTHQISEGQSEQFFKRPLLTIDEGRIHLAARTAEPYHPHHPGLALVIEAGTPPYIVRKSFYDMDPLFERTFTPNKRHDFVPLIAQPMLEYMYTDEQHFGFRMPRDFQAKGYELRPLPELEPGALIQRGAAFAELVGPPSTGYTPDRERIARIEAPFPLLITDVDDRPDQELSLVIRKQGRAALPAGPCNKVNRVLVAKAKSHRRDVRRREKEEAQRLEDERAAARRAEAQRLEDERNARYRKIMLWCAVAFVVWIFSILGEG